MREYAIGSARAKTVFQVDVDCVRLERLCGVRCAGTGEAVLPLLPAFASIRTNRGECPAEEFRPVESTFEDGAARIVWNLAGGMLRLQSLWSFCRETNVVARRDRITNESGRAIHVSGCRTRFVFPPGAWEVYGQQSRWCNENQGTWLPLHAGSIRFGCLPGRTSEGGTPYCCLRRVNTAEGLAFHVLPRGNWTIEIRARAVQDGLPYAVVTLGMADDDLRLELSPGETFELPEILIQPLPSGAPHLAAPALHHYVQGRFFPESAEDIPVVYNTWFDQFEVLEPFRLRGQLAAAKQIGCEVFVVDAGWYGPAADDWWSQAGDWRERTAAAFQGKMREFADEVRAAGLRFGLWMEPERFGHAVPIVKENPEWFLPGDGGFLRLDPRKPAAFGYLHDEISRLVDTYELGWMKVDFNFRLGPDPGGGELSSYYEAFYRLLDEIRRKYPRTVFEGCASGGLRLDLNTLSHFDGHFLSDTVDPVDVLRIWQGALLRLPPGRLIKWAVLRPVGRTIPTYTKSLADSPEAVVAPCGAIWEPARTVDIDFAAAVALPGIFGLGGDLAGLPAEARRRLAGHVEFFKNWRGFIRGARAHLLTPPQPKEDRQGWVGVQLTNPSSKDAMLFVYRLDDGAGTTTLGLRGLEAERLYHVSPRITQETPPRAYLGADLLHEGIRVDLPARFRAEVFILKAQ